MISEPLRYLGDWRAVPDCQLHWEETGIYIPNRDGHVPARVGLVFDLDADDADWRFGQPPPLLA